MAESLTPTHILCIINKLSSLCDNLPTSILFGIQADKMYHTLLHVNEGSPFETFNRIFDILFKEDSDCWDEQGRFHLIRRGKYGMDKLCVYLRGVNWDDQSIPLDLVKLKLDRVLNEVVYLMYDFSLSNHRSICVS